MPQETFGTSTEADGFQKGLAVAGITSVQSFDGERFQWIVKWGDDNSRTFLFDCLSPEEQERKRQAEIGGF